MVHVLPRTYLNLRYAFIDLSSGHGDGHLAKLININFFHNDWNRLTKYENGGIVPQGDYWGDENMCSLGHFLHLELYFNSATAF